MDATAMSKLKELVTSRRFKKAELLLSDYLLQSPNDYALLMHMGGVQTSMFNYHEAEQYYKKAIAVGKHQSGSAKMQLMRIYSSQSRDKDLIFLLLQCLETEPKSIILKEQIIQVYMKIFEYKSALIYSRKFIEQIKETNKTQTATDEHTKWSERAKVLSEPMKQSDFYFLHCQILNKVGRFSDCIMYCKKAISMLDGWIHSMPALRRNKILKSMEYRKRMNRYYGYLGLCYLNVDDVDNGLRSFKQAKNINSLDRIASNNIYNITQNRALFDRSVELKCLYQRFVSNKLSENDKKLDLKEAFMQYIQLLIQQNRLFLAGQICETFLNEKGGILGYGTAEFIIIYEDILRQEMNSMMKNMLEEVCKKMDEKRNKNGPQHVVMNEDKNMKDLAEKIWAIRAKIDYIYSAAIKLSAQNVNLHIGYALSLWRIGYNAHGIELKTAEWSKYNTGILKESRYYLSRGNAFINEDNNEKAMVELQNALQICENREEEVQTRLLMAVTLNKMNKLTEAKSECEQILSFKNKSNDESTLKMYAAILQRMGKYKKSKEIYGNLLKLKKNECNVTILQEYVSLLVEMREYEEAKRKLQFILSMNNATGNMLSLMYEYGLICYRLADLDAALKIFISIINQSYHRGSYMNIINIYFEKISDLNLKLNEMCDGEAAGKLQQEKETFMAECEGYLCSWIESDCYEKKGYFMYLEYLWKLNKNKKEIKKKWNDWINKMENEMSKKEEKKENEERCDGKQEKARNLLSDLYQKYARLLTQNKVVNNCVDADEDNKSDVEDESSNEEIEAYFSKSLELNDKNIETLQGFAAYYISLNEYVHALPFLRKATDLNKANSETWIQLARLCENISDVGEKPIVLLKNGFEYIKNFKYQKYKNYIKHMTQITQELIETLILFADATEAEEYCWFILNKLDPLNITALREISKVCDDRQKITTFFQDLLVEYPSYCPLLVEYAQFLTTAKQHRAEMLNKAEKLLNTAIKINKETSDELNMRYGCVALYILGFVKMHKLDKKKGITNDDNVKLNNEARELFVAAVDMDQNNIYARINLAQFLAFKDNENDKALIHLEFAYNNLTKNDPNLIANLIKVLAKKAIEKVVNNKEENVDAGDIDMALLRRAFKLCGDALRKYKGHFGLIVARSSLGKIKKKFGLSELNDGLNANEIEKSTRNPQTTFGMIGVDIVNMKKLKKNDDNQ